MTEYPMKKLDDLGDLDEATRAALANPDLDLITDYVAGELDPDQVEAVSRRLEEDAKFREFAAPILVAWGVAPHWQRFPMSRSEIEAGWDDFTRRAGFAHQKRRARRRRIIFGAMVLAVLAAGSWLARAPIAFALWQSGFDRVAGDTITLSDGTQVRLDSGATLDVHRRFGTDTARWVRLTGSARFIVAPNDSMPRFYVMTGAGLVYTNGAEFAVRATADSTEVRGGTPAARLGDAESQRAAPVYLAARAGIRNEEQVFPGEGAYVGPEGPVVKPRIVVARIEPPVEVVQAAAPPPAPPKPAPRPAIASLRGITVNPARALPGAGDMMTFPRGVTARIDRKTRSALREDPDVPPGQLIALDGAALFLVPRDTGAAFQPPTYIRGYAAYLAVIAPLALSVVTSGDTMVVRAFPVVPQQRGPRDPWDGSGAIEIYRHDLTIPEPRFRLLAGESARIVKGGNPEKLP